MDWTFKPSAWGFGEIGGEEEDGFAGGSSRLENNDNNVGVFSVDLKLGGSMEKPNGGSSKRACVIYGSCLVEGCTADLNNCREYYRRHRVCERHSKTPTVIVRGKQQRFCQQCSRFQSLEEFDEQKRSCRKRLDGHNRRRRKPQRKPFSLSSGSFLSNDQDLYLTIVEPGPDCSLLAMHQGAHNSASNGGRQLSCSPSSYTTSAAAAGAVPSWPVKHEQDQHFSNHQTEIPNSSATGGGGGGKTFPFLLTNDTGRSNQTVPDIPTHHWLDDNNHKQVLLSGELVVNSKRALSLLSTRVTNRPTTDVQFDDDSVPYPPNNTVGISSYNEGFHVAPDDMLAEGASHVLPFCWK